MWEGQCTVQTLKSNSSFAGEDSKRLGSSRLSKSNSSWVVPSEEGFIGGELFFSSLPCSLTRACEGQQSNVWGVRGCAISISNKRRYIKCQGEGFEMDPQRW